MAKCDQGYLCAVCGEEVKRIDQSELYLRYVLGWVSADSLHAQPERHLLCSPVLAQFIRAAEFEQLEVKDDFNKRHLDPEFRRQREEAVTAGYERLKYLQKHRRNLKIEQYPHVDMNRSDSGHSALTGDSIDRGPGLE